MTASGQEPGAGGSPGGTESTPTGETPGDLSGFDRAINDLHSRISDLRVSVDDLGTGAPSPPGLPPEPPPAAYPPPPPPSPSPSADPYAPPPADPYAPPPATGYPAQPPPQAFNGPAYPPAYAEPPPPYAAGVATDAYGMPVAAPAQAPEGSDALGTFFRVDVGPFEDLLAMTAFEEQLSALPSMADVRVRRFGTGRAEIELEMHGPAPFAREVRRIAPEAETVVQPDGTLTVMLGAEQWTGGVVEPEAVEDGPAEGALEQGDEHG